MKNKILQTIKKHNLIRDNMHIVLGLSGGPDSVCLFNVLMELSADMNLKVYPVHVNHKFRPGAAEEDQAYVEELCKARGLQCRTFVTDCAAMAAELKMTAEEAGRKARYDAFFTVADQIAAEGAARENIAVAVAHNAGDQCETILFRILRGTGTDGLAGIAYKRAGRNGTDVIRPLLDVSRSEIEKYCTDCNLQPRIDHTNNEAIYMRNKIRLELIPYLAENYNENIIDTINRLGMVAAADSDYLRSEAIAAYEKAACPGDECSLFTGPLTELHKSIRFRVYNICLSRAGMGENITMNYLEAIDKVRRSASPSAGTQLSDGYRVSKVYDKLVFYREEEKSNPAENWNIKVMTVAEYETYASEMRKEGRVYAAFSGGAVAAPEKLQVRTRKDGDYILISGGRKKLQDFFVDSKVPKIYRDSMAILALGSAVLWVMPSEHFPDEAYRQKGRFSAGYRADFGKDDTIIVLEQK